MNGLSSWVPSEVLVGALTLVLGLLYKLVIDRAKKQDAALEKIQQALIELDKRFLSAASVEQLGRMGDRFDGRITALAQDVAVMKAVHGKNA